MGNEHLEHLSREQLMDLVNVYSKNWLALDGLWFQSVEKEQGMDAATIYEEVKALNQRNSASFILDTLAFLHAGGRCSSLAHMGANLMSIKPSIRVLNDKNGSMTVGKKYFGKLKKCIVAYIHDQLDGRTDIVRDRIFITHSGFPEADIEWMKEEVEKYGPWGEIIVTTAGCTISSHCGPGCIGVLFLTK